MKIKTVNKRKKRKEPRWQEWEIKKARKEGLRLYNWMNQSEVTNE